MNNTNKGKANIILGSLSVLSFAILTLASFSLPVRKNNFHTGLTDTLPFSKPADSNRVRVAGDSTFAIKDTIPVSDTFHFKASKDSLDNPVSYHADDSMVLDVPGKKIFLYGKSSTVKYIDNELSAPQIEYDQNTNLVKAFLTKDSLGNVIAYPK